MPAPPHYDVITCRGVLNDLIIDADREAALWAMSRALRPGGFLFCDVREAGASVSTRHRHFGQQEGDPA
jgi:chemotaxis methyl-accepting protein methylase